MPDQPRPVWLNRDQRRHLTQMGTLADRHGFPVLVEACDEIAAAWATAPSDPTEAAAKAIFDSSRESDDECSWDDEPNEWIKKAYRDYEALAVLRALGKP